jgi:hypothetical protein
MIVDRVVSVIPHAKGHIVVGQEVEEGLLLLQRDDRILPTVQHQQRADNTIDASTESDPVEIALDLLGILRPSIDAACSSVRSRATGMPVVTRAASGCPLITMARLTPGRSISAATFSAAVSTPTTTRCPSVS